MKKSFKRYSFNNTFTEGKSDEICWFLSYDLSVYVVLAVIIDSH